MRKGRSLHHRLCIVFSVFDDDDGHKRGQTSRPVVGTAIQTNCNFEAHVYYCNYLLVDFFLSPYILYVQLLSYIILPGNIIRIVHKKIFSHSQISPGTSTRSTTAEPNKCTEHGAIQRGSIQCTVGAVSISCLLCTTMYSEYCDRSYQKYSFLLFVIYKVAIILLCFNSTLNPFLYCWKISETSNEADNPKCTLLSMELDHPRVIH
ncbi:unnamed protein product, partial [Pocillopora meandrina]